MTFSPMLMTELLADEHRRDLRATAAARRNPDRLLRSASRSQRLLARLLHHEAV
jgi:hypothetical protein